MTIRDEDRGLRFETQIIAEIPVLLNVATSMCNQPADAHDLVQDNLARAWRSFDTFDGDYPRAWLLTIMRNANVNANRRQRPITIDLDESTNPTIVPTEVSAEDTAMNRRLDDVVEKAISTLKPAAKEVLVLVDVDGLSYREAGVVLGVPEGTVMSRLHRARAAVRKQIESARKESVLP